MSEKMSEKVILILRMQMRFRDQCSHPLTGVTIRPTWMDPPLPTSNGTPIMSPIAGMEFTENVLPVFVSPIARCPLASYTMCQRDNFEKG